MGSSQKSGLSWTGLLSGSKSSKLMSGSVRSHTNIKYQFFNLQFHNFYPNNVGKGRAFHGLLFQVYSSYGGLWIEFWHWFASHQWHNIQYNALQWSLPNFSQKIGLDYCSPQIEVVLQTSIWSLAEASKSEAPKLTLLNKSFSDQKILADLLLKLLKLL